MHKNLEEFLARQGQVQARSLREYAVRAAAGQVLVSLSREMWQGQETVVAPDVFYPLIERHLQDFQALSGPNQRANSRRSDA